MNGVLKLLGILAELLQGFMNKWKQDKAQEERDELEADPHSWYDGHFGGLQRKDSTSETDKTESDSTEEK